MIELSRYAQRVTQIEVTDPQHIHTGCGCNPLNVVQPRLALDLAYDSGVFVGVLRELSRVDALEIGVRRADGHPSLAQRRVFGSVNNCPCLIGALDIRYHHAQRADVQSAGDEIVFDLGNAHKGSDSSGLEPGHHVSDIGCREAGMLHINQGEIDAGDFQHPGHASGGKLQHHVADRNLALGQNLFEAIGFHAFLLSCKYRVSARCLPGQIAPAVAQRS